jgi:hypothetical protein
MNELPGEGIEQPDDEAGVISQDKHALWVAMWPFCHSVIGELMEILELDAFTSGDVAKLTKCCGIAGLR